MLKSILLWPQTPFLFCLRWFPPMNFIWLIWVSLCLFSAEWHVAFFRTTEGGPAAAVQAFPQLCRVEELCLTRSHKISQDLTRLKETWRCNACAVCRSGKTTEGNDEENATKWLRRCLLMFRPKKSCSSFEELDSWHGHAHCMTLAHRSWLSQPAKFSWKVPATSVIFCLVVVLFKSTIIEPEMWQGKETWQQDYGCGRCFGALVVCIKCCKTRSDCWAHTLFILVSSKWLMLPEVKTNQFACTRAPEADRHVNQAEARSEIAVICCDQVQGLQGKDGHKWVENSEGTYAFAVWIWGCAISLHC